MKKLKLFAFIGLLAMVFTACEKDDDFTIVGKWNIDKMTVTATMGGVELYSETDTNTGWIEFKSDGTGVDDTNDTFNWTLSGSNLTIIDSEETIVLKLTKMEKNNVVGEYSYSYTQDGFTIDVKMVIELRRL